MKGTDDTVTNQILAMTDSIDKISRLMRSAETVGHFGAPVGKNQKVVKLLACDFDTLIEINEFNGDYYGHYYYHWINETENKVYLQLFLKAFGCGHYLRCRSEEPETFSFTEEEFEEKVYIHKKQKELNMETKAPDIQAIIKRHEENGYTRTDAVKFYNQVTLMINRGAITREEGNQLLKEGTIDCID